MQLTGDFIVHLCVCEPCCAQSRATLQLHGLAHQAPLSVGFSRQECWSRLPFSTAGDLPNSGVKLMSSALTGGFFTTVPPGKPAGLPITYCICLTLRECLLLGVY